MWSVPAICFALAGFTILLSLPGMPEQVRDFVEWVGMSGADWHWWNYLGVSIGLILMFLSIYPAWRRILRFVGTGGLAVNWQAVGVYTKALWLPVLSLAALISVTTGLIYYVAFVYERPKWVWTHPAFSFAEIQKEKARCEMRAIEAVGGGPKIGSARYEYESACLAARGFSLKREEDVPATDQ